MSNRCFNEMVIYAKKERNNKKQLKRLAQYLKKAIIQEQKEINQKPYRTYEILRCYKNKPIFNGKLGYMEGRIKDYFKIEKNEEYVYMTIIYESAWKPILEGWNSLLEKYSLKQVTLAEESKNLVYINTDKEGIFFKQKYVLDCKYNGEFIYETFNSLQELINYFKETNLYFFTNNTSFGKIKETMEMEVIEDNIDNHFILEEFANE